MLESLEPSDCKERHVILDEADAGIDETAVLFTESNSLKGLVSLKYAESVYFMSATFDPL